MRRALLLSISLSLLLGSCGEKSSSEGSESVGENPTTPSEEVKPVEEKQQEVTPEEPVAETKPAEEAPVNPIKYKITGDAVTITGCDKKASGALTIPATIEGKAVTNIGWYAFQPCSSLTSITIPDSVTSIGVGAFVGCTSLTSITIPDSVTSIGAQAFWECGDLTSITIPDSVTSIGDFAFYGCSSLTSITIGDGVTSIGERAFYGCTSLTSISIPDSVTSIGEGAFAGCTSLTSINVGAGNLNYTDVNGVLFNKGKTTLVAYPAGKTGTNYTVPDSVTSIGGNAFASCYSLTSINVGAGNLNYTDVNGVLFNKGKTVLLTYPEGKTGANYTMPDGVTSIGVRAFGGCKSLTSITIPDSVTSIGVGAFVGCSNLTSIIIGNGVTSIGGYAFRYCINLTSISIPDSVTSIGNGAFYECTSLTAVIFLGNAPKVEGPLVFLLATPTIYRKPDAKGWGETWCGRPVKLISEKP